MDLQAINEVKVTHQGQHQIEVIFKERYCYAGGLHLNQMRSCCIWGGGGGLGGADTSFFGPLNLDLW